MVRRVFFSEKTDTQTLTTTTGEGDVIMGTDQDGSGTQFGCTVSSPVIGYKYLIEVNLQATTHLLSHSKFLKKFLLLNPMLVNQIQMEHKTLNHFPQNNDAHLLVGARTIFAATATTDIFFGVYARPDSTALTIILLQPNQY